MAVNIFFIYMPDIIIYSFTVAICFISGLFSIFYIQDNKRGNLWFGIFLISLGFALLSKAIWDEKIYTAYSHIIPLSEMSRFVIAPAFYLSTWHYTHLSKMAWCKILLHFIPTLLFLLFISFPYFFSATTISAVFNRTLNNIMRIIMITAVPLQIIIYWIISYRLLQKHTQSILLFSSQSKSRNLSWFSSILFWFLIIILISFSHKFYDIQPITALSPLLYLSLVLFMVYNLLKQKEVFMTSKSDNLLLENVITQYKTASDKTSRLSPEDILHYKTALDNLLSVEEIYTDPEINLSSLAEKTGLSMNDLSYLINTSYKMNFYGLINNYRIEKVKQMLLNEKYSHLTILGVAYESGFTSKSTFNDLFKKYTGITPREYVKNNS